LQALPGTQSRLSGGIASRNMMPEYDGVAEVWFESEINILKVI
jgi:hypothetical protein